MADAKIASTLKSGDTEEWLDIVFTRPIGYRWALFFNKFDVHPNVVTIISMILGAGAGVMFMSHDLLYNIIGVLLLMQANFYDSCDGQLARMTGKKTRLGRILDGFAGDVWFFTIYVAIMFRLFDDRIPFTDIQWGWLAIVLACVCGILFHSRQSGLADYYRNIHLFFIKGENGSELDNSEREREKYQTTPWKGNFLWKLSLFFYARYTKTQESQTPVFQRMMSLIKETYGMNIPQALRDEFRAGSLPLMKWANILTFNVRAIVLYISCLVDETWIYLVFEATIMNVIYIYMRTKHETLCGGITKKLKNKLRQEN